MTQQLKEPRSHTVRLTDEEVELLLRGMETHIQMARRMKFPLAQVQPYIALLHTLDNQTLTRHRTTTP